jgi:hypothetical protein
MAQNGANESGRSWLRKWSGHSLIVFVMLSRFSGNSERDLNIDVLIQNCTTGGS